MLESDRIRQADYEEWLELNHGLLEITQVGNVGQVFENLGQVFENLTRFGPIKSSELCQDCGSRSKNSKPGKSWLGSAWNEWILNQRIDALKWLTLRTL